MRPGESFVGQPIRSLQTMLRVLGESDRKYQRLIPDGIYGPQTIAAVTGEVTCATMTVQVYVK